MPFNGVDVPGFILPLTRLTCKFYAAFNEDDVPVLLHALALLLRKPEQQQDDQALTTPSQGRWTLDLSAQMRRLDTGY